MSSVSKDSEEKQQALQELFKKSPETTIQGVVSISGVGAGKAGDGELWSLNLNLIAWRTETSPVKKTKLAVTKEVTHEELTQLGEQIDPKSVVTLHVRLCENSPFGDARAQLIKLLDHQPDPELETILLEYKKPIQIKDSLLGTLTFNRSLEWFEGQVLWMRKTIDLCLCLDDTGSHEDALKTAKTLFADMAAWSEKAYNCATDKLLNFKTDNWLDDNDSPFDSELFIKGMTLDSITCEPCCNFAFRYRGCPPFLGHSVRIGGSLTKGFT